MVRRWRRFATSPRSRVSSPERAILIHGNGGSTAADIWLPWVERSLAALGVGVTNVTFPDNVKARAQ